ncbi:copper resistance protein CopC [Glycomyces harbinensis]|uniref:Copper transport protein n=1 Tax=Glycomyces harbinensis TaxID=58114 RepID=A0A1G6R3F8_9ACTN|nr:copper resistance protein CopC [Glycomyces harbinensis]SDC98605.1 copper transport protein [Glycomyces harbinensis]
MTVLHRPAPAGARLAVLAALAALILLLAPAAPARAHAALLSTDPEDQAALDEAPTVITLHFSEPVQPVPDGVELIGTDGTTYVAAATANDRDVVVATGGLGDGRFFLNWRVTSADGHPIAGVLEFSVGDAPPPGATDDQAAQPVRWPVMALAALHYAGLLLFAGLLCFRIAIARGHRPPHPRHRLLRTAAATAIAATVLAVPVGALDAAGLPPSRIADVAAWSDLARAETILLAAATTLGLLTAYRCFTRGLRPAALTAASLALAAPALTGHTRTYDPGWLMTAADLVHLAAGAVWLGGLAGLAILLRTATDPAATAEVVARFSTWAAATLAALGASGVTMALVLHRTWSSLLESEHGIALLAKLDLVALAVALAAWNRYLLVPVVRKAAGDWAGLRRLRRVLLGEAAAVALAVAATGVMVNLSPAAPEPPPSEPVAITADLGPGTVNAVLDPGRAGENTLRFALYDAQALPLDPVEPPMVLASLPAQDFGPVQAAVELDPAGGYLAVLDLPLEGGWEIEFHVLAATDEHYIATAAVQVD